MLGLSSSLAKGGASLLTFVKDNLKLYLDFKSNKSDTLKFPSEGSTSFAYADKVTFTQQTFTGAFSVVCWFNGDVNTDYKRLFGDSSPPSGTNDILVKDTNGQVAIRINGNYKANISSVPNNTWSHLAFTRDDNGNIKSYLNGVASGTHTSTDTFTLDNIGGDGGGAVMSMCNAGLWSRELSQEEVQSIMNKSYSQLKDVEKTSLEMWQSLDSTGFGSDLTLGKGSFEDGNGWAVFGSPVTLGYSTTNVYLGSQSLHITNASNNKGAQLVGQFAIVSGEQIYVDAWVYVVDGTKVQMGINSTTDSLFKEFTVTANTWTNITHTYTTNSTGYTYVLFSATDGFDEFYVDNCTAKKVGFNDSTSNNNFGVNNGSTTTTSVYGGNAPILPRAVDVAKEGQADAIGNGSASFNGSSDYVDISNTFQSVFRSAFTVSAWIKPDDGQPSGINALFGSDSTGDQDRFRVMVKTDGKIGLLYKSNNNNAGTIDADTTNAVFSNGGTDWTHIAVTLSQSGGTVTGNVYVNGIAVAGTFSGSQTMADFATTTNFAIGGANRAGSLTQYFDGNISQVGIWHGKLTQAQIQSVMESTSYSKIPADVKSTLGNNVVSYNSVDNVNNTFVNNIATYTANGYIFFSGVAPVSTLFKLEYTVLTSTASGLRLAGGSSAFGVVALDDSVGTHSYNLISSSNSNANYLSFNSTGFRGTITDISVKPISNEIVSYYPLDGVQTSDFTTKYLPDATGGVLGAELFTGWENEPLQSGTYYKGWSSFTTSGQTVTASQADEGAVYSKVFNTNAFSVVAGTAYEINLTIDSRVSTFIRGFTASTNSESNVVVHDLMWNNTIVGSAKYVLLANTTSSSARLHIRQQGGDGTASITISAISIKPLSGNYGRLI